MLFFDRNSEIFSVVEKLNDQILTIDEEPRAVSAHINQLQNIYNKFYEIFYSFTKSSPNNWERLAKEVGNDIVYGKRDKAGEHLKNLEKTLQKFKDKNKGDLKIDNLDSLGKELDKVIQGEVLDSDKLLQLFDLCSNLGEKLEDNFELKKKPKEKRQLPEIMASSWHNFVKKYSESATQTEDDPEKFTNLCDTSIKF